MRTGSKTPTGLALAVGLVVGLIFWLHTPSRAQQLMEKPFIATAAGRPTHVPGELLVKFRLHVSRDQIVALNTKQNSTILGYHPALDIYRIEVRGDAQKTAATYHSSAMVQWAQPNHILYPSFVPTDPLYQNFQGTPTDLQKWYFGADNLNAEEAWDITTGRSDVVIAIIDSGIGIEHPDLADNIWVNPEEIPGNNLDDDNNGFVDDIHGYDFCSGPFNPQRICSGIDNDPQPELGDGIDNDEDGFVDNIIHHGTFVAGTAAAIGDNARFGTGAAPNVKLMALKVFTDDGGAPTNEILAALSYAIENGADVINLSLGGLSGIDCPTITPAFETAITTAFNQGVVVVAAAGNDNGHGPSSPASCTHAIAVGSSGTGITSIGGPGLPGEIDERASFANFGRRPGQRFGIDVVAPGARLVGPMVCGPADDVSNLLGCNLGDFTSVIGSGTSFSSPLVAGLAALVISRARDLDQAMPPTQVRTIIQSTTQDLPDDPNDVPNAGPNWDGQGRVDFLAAVMAVEDSNDSGEVSCDITMSQQTYVTDDEVVVTGIRITNSGLEPVPVEIKTWHERPGLPSRTLQITDIMGALPPESDQDFGPLPLFPVTVDTPRGIHEINCRLLDPVTGAILSSDKNPFEIQ